MIKGVIFDLGNTLMYWDADGKAIDAQANAVLIEFLNTNGIPVGEDFVPLFRAARQQGWKEAEETHLEHTVEQALAEALGHMGHTALNGLLTRAVKQFFAAGEIYQRLYPETLSALDELKKRGLKIGLISNADDDGLVQRAVVRLGLEPYLDPVLSSAGLKWRKPNPNIFKHVAEKWRLAPGEIAMVGDGPRYDILGAHLAGLRGILIDRGEGHWWQKIPEQEIHNPALQPDATVHSLLEISSTLEQMG